jgi:SAM-dependent methyltransferase
MFPPISFDVITCFNSLDHVENPVLGLEQMFKVMAPDGFIYGWCYQKEGEFEKYRGLHQWDFDIKEGEVILRGRDQEFQKITILLQNKVTCQGWKDEKNGKNIVHFIIRRAL